MHSALIDLVMRNATCNKCKSSIKKKKNFLHQSLDGNTQAEAGKLTKSSSYIK